MGKLSGIEPLRMNWLAGDLPTEFASFRQYCELIFRGPFADKDESALVTYILLWVGQEGLRMYNTWDLSDSDSKKVDVIIEPKANFWLSRCNLLGTKFLGNCMCYHGRVIIEGCRTKCVIDKYTNIFIF